MQKILFFFFITLAFTSCSQQPQYGKSPLVLDQFNFDLDVASFYKDENIFRGNSDFSVSASEISYDYKDRKMDFVQYATRSMSRKNILARYGIMDFESLGMVTDSADEKVLLVSAGTDYATAEQVTALIEKLQKAYGQGSLERNHSLFSGEDVKLVFKTKDKVLKLVLEDLVATPEEEETGSDEESQALPPFDEKAKARVLAAAGKKKKNIHVYLFVVTPVFDEVMEHASQSSGDLTHY